MSLDQRQVENILWKFTLTPLPLSFDRTVKNRDIRREIESLLNSIDRSYFQIDLLDLLESLQLSTEGIDHVSAKQKCYISILDKSVLVYGNFTHKTIFKRLLQHITAPTSMSDWYTPAKHIFEPKVILQQITYSLPMDKEKAASILQHATTIDPSTQPEVDLLFNPTYSRPIRKYQLQSIILWYQEDIQEKLYIEIGKTFLHDNISATSFDRIAADLLFQDSYSSILRFLLKNTDYTTWVEESYRQLQLLQIKDDWTEEDLREIKE